MLASHIIAVMMGGALGSLMRYISFILLIQQGAWYKSIIPLSSLAVNSVGCFMTGALFTYVSSLDQESAWKSFILVGLLGSFTAFSTVVLEIFEVFIRSNIYIALLFLLISILCSTMSFLIAMKIFA